MLLAVMWQLLASCRLCLEVHNTFMHSNTVWLLRRSWQGNRASCGSRAGAPSYQSLSWLGAVMRVSSGCAQVWYKQRAHMLVHKYLG